MAIEPAACNRVDGKHRHTDWRTC